MDVAFLPSMRMRNGMEVGARRSRPPTRQGSPVKGAESPKFQSSAVIEEIVAKMQKQMIVPAGKPLFVGGNESVSTDRSLDNELLGAVGRSVDDDTFNSTQDSLDNVPLNQLSSGTQRHESVQAHALDEHAKLQDACVDQYAFLKEAEKDGQRVESSRTINLSMLHSYEWTGLGTVPGLGETQQSVKTGEEPREEAMPPADPVVEKGEKADAGDDPAEDDVSGLYQHACRILCAKFLDFVP